MQEYVATVDIDSNTIRYGVIEAHGGITEAGRYPQAAFALREQTERIPDADALRERVPGLIRTLQKEYDLSGVCIATAGMVEPVRGVVFHAPDGLPSYAGTNWKEIIREATGLCAEADNRVNCLALAEYISGAAMSASSALCMTIGDTLGGCIITDGKIWRGATLSACEIGYLPMYGSTFETLSSNAALIRKVAAIKGKLRFDWTEERIFEEAVRGDADCIRAIDEMCEVLGRGISTICYVANPEVVVLGGGIMAHHAFFLPRIRAAMEKYLIEPVMLGTFFASAAYGKEGAMLGAFYHYHAMQSQGNQ